MLIINGNLEYFKKLLVDFYKVIVFLELVSIMFFLCIGEIILYKLF